MGANALHAEVLLAVAGRRGFETALLSGCLAGE